MAGEQKRKNREVMVTKALLLGYVIAWDDLDKGYGLWKPDGARFRIDTALGRTGRAWTTPHWPAPWLAAREALKLSGVPHETDVPRDLGIGSSKGWRLRGGNILRGRFKSLFGGPRSLKG